MTQAAGDDLHRARQLCEQVLAGELGLDGLAAAVRGIWELADVAYGSLPPQADELAVVAWLHGTPQYALNGGDARFRSAIRQLADGAPATPPEPTPVVDAPAVRPKGPGWTVAGVVAGAGALVVGRALLARRAQDYPVCGLQEIWDRFSTDECARSGVLGLLLLPTGLLVLVLSLGVLLRRARAAARAGLPWPLRRALARAPGGLPTELTSGLLASVLLAVTVGGYWAWHRHRDAVDLEHRHVAEQALRTLVLPAGLTRAADPCSGPDLLCAESAQSPAAVRADVIRLLHGSIRHGLTACPSNTRFRLPCAVVITGRVAGYPAEAVLTDRTLNSREGPVPPAAVPLRYDGKGPLYLLGSRLTITLLFPAG